MLHYQMITSHGTVQSEQSIEIVSGDNVFDVGDKLSAAHIISWKAYFVAYVWKENARHTIIAGKYKLSGAMTIPEITRIITQGEVVPKGVTVVFPEGWESQKIADRLSANGLPGDAFLELVAHPRSAWREEFWFLKDMPEGASLEGFLFPDTYTLSANASAETIIVTMLKNFDVHFPTEAREALRQKGESVFDIVTLASIVETEVQTDYDRKVVADLFARRIANDMPLQSDATVKYVRKENKVQHSFEETRVDSPYNTYVYKGLPPGPISNPGLSSLVAVLAPIPNEYVYFLSDTQTGETVFARTFEEHKRNKTQHGL